MAKAKKLPSGNWRVQLFTGYDAHGKRIYESFTAPTAAEANLMADRRKYELERGIKKDRIPSDMTVGDAVSKYIEERDGVLKPKTIREYKGYRRLYMQGIMDIRLKNLTESIVQREINRESKRLSPKSVRNIWALVSASIKNAVPDMIYTVKLPAKIKNDFKIPTNEELERLLRHIEGTQLEIPVLLAAMCGLRRGEISALDLHEDVDYQNNTINVNKAMSNTPDSTWISQSTKTYESSRIVDAPEWVIAKLAAARDSGYKNMNPAHITSAFKRKREQVGVSVRFHDLRHYYASVMLSLGVPDKYAMARMGHATPNMLKNVYQHLMDDKNREITTTMNAYFEAMQHEMQHTPPQDKEKKR